METAVDWPAWVQAIGSVVAIFAAVGVAAWQSHASEKARRVDQQSALRDRFEAALYFVTEARQTCRLMLMCTTSMRHSDVVVNEGGQRDFRLAMRQ